MEQRHVLDVLRPDRREAGDRARAGGAAPAIAAAPLRTVRRGRPLAPCDPAAPSAWSSCIWPPVRFSLAAAARRRPSAWASCLAQLRIGGESRADAADVTGTGSPARRRATLALVGTAPALPVARDATDRARLPRLRAADGGADDDVGDDDRHQPAAIPATALDLGAPTNVVQLTVPIFFVGFAIGQAVYGSCSDRFGRKPVLLVGTILFIWQPRLRRSAGCRDAAGDAGDPGAGCRRRPGAGPGDHSRPVPRRPDGARDVVRHGGVHHRRRSSPRRSVP